MLFERLGEREKYNEPFALVTIIGATGTVSRRSGRMAVFPDGRTEGTIGGGAHESEAVRYAVAAIHDGRNRREKIKVSEYGEIEIMIDVPIKERRVIVIGAGHVGKAIYDTFHYLGWHVRVVDTRPDILTEESFPYAGRVIGGTIRECIEKSEINSNTAVVITMPDELGSIQDILDSSAAFYIGILSSRKRKSPPGERYHMPMGLSIGEETPREIALSVAAETLMAYTKSKGISHSRKMKRLVVVRGAGDLATGAIVALNKAGYMVIATEIEKPTVIRRTVSFADTIYSGHQRIEGVDCVLCHTPEECLMSVKEGSVALIVDKEGSIIDFLRPNVVVDAILAKKNLGTRINMAPFVVALGPGFECGKDCHVIIETMRGHNLSRILYSGSAIPNTGVPGLIAGCGKERVMHTPSSGIFKENAVIGDIVEKGDIIAYVGDVPLYASISGKLRGLLHSGLYVPEAFKAADIDPRGEEVDHMSISDKARAIGSSVVVAVDEFMASYN